MVNRSAKSATLITADRATPNARNNVPIIAVGASAGGLEACTRLLDAIKKAEGAAVLLVQHLPPTHSSMLVELLSVHTTMPIVQATARMRIEAGHVYIIPPGKYMTVVAGVIQLSDPVGTPSVRLPFDALLNSLAAMRGSRAIAVVLSGTGADGAGSLQSLRENDALIIAQDPTEAEYRGMPDSAIATGLVNHVAMVDEMPALIHDYLQRRAANDHMPATVMHEHHDDSLAPIIDLLRTTGTHDFSLYKRGTLQRRIDRRLAMAGIPQGQSVRYVDILRNDRDELDALANDLLINVTRFFRDPAAFVYLAERILPGLIEAHPLDQPLRVWVAGCSTGEEAYSLAILLKEQIALTGRDLTLQIFASDIDVDAVAQARLGQFSTDIEHAVSAERRERFFSRNERGYRINPDIRSLVVFTVQNLLTDPPFSRLNIVSCRNVLIYLQPDAQAKVLDAFHFALREHGILFLGGAETIPGPTARFETISKSERLYRRRGRERETGKLVDAITSVADLPALRDIPSTQQPPSLAEFCRRIVTERYAPAAVIVNGACECLHSIGPTDRYLRVASGSPSYDLFSMAKTGIRPILRAAIKAARDTQGRAVTEGGKIKHDGQTYHFNVDVQPLRRSPGDLLLICFVDQPQQSRTLAVLAGTTDSARASELEQELVATRAELQDANRHLEIADEEQRAVVQEALSVNEEFQSANEELITSKEELQSLNEELTALNSQLQETLDRQHTTFNDLQNILYSTDVATLFLDPELKIRFFTPAIRTLFHLIPADIGRPLLDLHSLAGDATLLADAATTLRTSKSSESEIETHDGIWFQRRVLPYRTHDEQIAGVVITFNDVTERKHINKALEVAKQDAESANHAKSRFLAAASHDLRQPLQTLKLLQDLLTHAEENVRKNELAARIGQTIGAMSGMLNALLDINQIESGNVRPNMTHFNIGYLIEQLRDEFTYHAQARGLELRIAPCSLSIYSDPRLLEQMIRNLVGNAIKYTESGKILLGCRRHGLSLRVEVLDTGIGIPDSEMSAIFNEYHQLDNADRKRSRGLGLGLSIVQRLAVLMGHEVNVCSEHHKGSVFSIDIARSVAGEYAATPEGQDTAKNERSHRTGTILLVEDDAQMRLLVDDMLRDGGHMTRTAGDGASALSLFDRGMSRPDLILTDYNLPHGMNGIDLIMKLRERFQCNIPAIVLSGDVSRETVAAVAHAGCMRLGKPIKVTALIQAVQALLPVERISANSGRTKLDRAASTPEKPIVFIVDDDSHVRKAIRTLLEAESYVVHDYADCESFLATYQPGFEACLLVDADLPGMSGLALLQQLKAIGNTLPSIMIAGRSDVDTAVLAMKAGASDFIEKPIGREQVLRSLDRALEQFRDAHKLSTWRDEAAEQIAHLTPRQVEIMNRIVAGQPSKIISSDLGISQRTVENHRAAIMKKTGSRSMPALARLALAAAWEVEA